MSPDMMDIASQVLLKRDRLVVNHTIMIVDVLLEAGRRSSRHGIENKLRMFAATKLKNDIKKMHDLCDEIIADRITNPQPDSQDFKSDTEGRRQRNE
jgi:hypothetical protein